METLTTKNLELAVDKSEPGLIRVFWIGRANQRRPGRRLRPFFEALLDEVERTQRALVFHLGGLTHLNSATIALIMQLVGELRGQGISMTLVYDNRLKWQRLTFDALHHLAAPGSGLSILGADRQPSPRGLEQCR